MSRDHEAPGMTGACLSGNSMPCSHVYFVDEPTACCCCSAGSQRAILEYPGFTALNSASVKARAAIIP